MSYVLQQKHHTYINYDVNRLANVWLDNSATVQFWRCCYEIQQMALLRSTAVLHFICSTRLLAETTPSVGFQKAIFVWREAHKTLVLYNYCTFSNLFQTSPTFKTWVRKQEIFDLCVQYLIRPNCVGKASDSRFTWVNNTIALADQSSVNEVLFLRKRSQKVRNPTNFLNS